MNNLNETPSLESIILDTLSLESIILDTPSLDTISLNSSVLSDIDIYSQDSNDDLITNKVTLNNHSNKCNCINPYKFLLKKYR